MRYLVRRYFSGYCTYEVEAENEDMAYELVKNRPVNQYELIATLEDWTDCDEVEPVEDD